MRNQAESQERSNEGATHQAKTNASVLDPVCGMEISHEDAVGSYVHEGKEYFFCNPSCLENFSANPSRYLNPGQIKVDSAGGEASERAARTPHELPGFFAALKMPVPKAPWSAAA